MRPDMGYSDALWSLDRVTPTPSRLPQALPASPVGPQGATLARCAPQTASLPAPGHHRATARQTTPLADLPLLPGVGRLHAARSPARTGGGAPPRGITPMHTSRCPQV